MADRSDEHIARATGHKAEDGIHKLLKSGPQFVLERNGKPALKTNLRFCGSNDLEEIMQLQQLVYDGIRDKATFVLTTAEELAESIDYDICIGAYHCGRLIGFTLMVVYPFSSRNLGLSLGYTPQQCAKCATYDTTFVDPSYNGYGLQRVFIKLKDKLAADVGAEEVLATVSPDNTYSIKNLESGGFTIAGRKKMYGEFDRLILKKQLKIRKDLI